MASPILIAKGKQPLCLLPQMANRHGLVAGATGRIDRAFSESCEYGVTSLLEAMKEAAEHFTFGDMIISVDR